LIALTLLAASAYALYYTNYTAYFVWSPTYTFDNFYFVGIAVTKEPITLGDWAVPVDEVILDGLPPDTLIKDLSRYRRTTIYGIDPGMRASPWLPNGTHIEYTFTRATAQFESVEVDVRRDVKWYVFVFHYNDIWWRKPVGVRYGLQIAAKSDDRPVFDFNCLRYVKTDKIARGVSREVYNATCPGYTSTVYYVHVYFMYVWTGEKKLCIRATSFNAGEYVTRKRDDTVLVDYCHPAEKPPPKHHCHSIALGRETEPPRHLHRRHPLRHPVDREPQRQTLRRPLCGVDSRVCGSQLSWRCPEAAGVCASACRQRYGDGSA